MQTEQHDSSLLLFTSSLHTFMSDQFHHIKANQLFLGIDVGLGKKIKTKMIREQIAN